MSKADLKETAGNNPGVRQLPVTNSTPYVCAPIPPPPFPGLFKVLDPLGGFLFWATEDQARELLSKRQAVLLWRGSGRKKRVCGLQAIVELDVPPDKICTQKRFFGLPHKHETDTNPPRVWTQDKMGDSSSKSGDNSKARWCRKVCRAVVTSCIKRAA